MKLLLKMPKILIVEDELIAAEYLKEVLQNNGFEVIGVIDNGKEAVSEIPKINPDIVLMDIMLRDGISGSEVALSLKQNAPKIGIIFLTAYADEEMVEYAIESNSYGYLMKPYNEKEIINTLKVVHKRLKENNEDDAKRDLNTSLVKIDKHLSFNIEKDKLFRDNVEVTLGAKALKLVGLLCAQANNSVSNEQICLHIYKEMKTSATLRTQIHRIRVILGEDIIQNVNGLGYMIKTI